MNLQISAHATYDSEQVTYGAQMRAMRHLKGMHHLGMFRPPCVIP